MADYCGVDMEHRKCSIRGCGKKHCARGWCQMHYRRWKLYGDPGTAEMRAVRLAPDATERPCTICGHTLPFDAFPKVKWGNGVGSRCKLCERIYLGEYYEQNREHVLAQVKGYQERNADVVAERRRAHYEANKARIIRRIRAYERARPQVRAEWMGRRRARVKAATVVPVEPQALLEKLDYWGGRCWICRAPATQWDHVKPLIKGGPHMLANLRPACLLCNTRKKARWPFPTISVLARQHPLIIREAPCLTSASPAPTN